MPKDPTKNIDRYKIRGGVINEYEYHQNQEALAQNEPPGDGKLIPGTPPEEKEEGLQPSVAATVTKSAEQATKAKRNRPQKGTKSTKSTKTEKAANRSKSSTPTKSSKATKSSKSKTSSKSVTAGKATKTTKAGKAGKSAKKSTSQTMRGATAKKLAARKAAKK